MTNTNEKHNVVASATLRGAKVSPRKTRLVVNMVKNKHVESALSALAFSKQKRAGMFKALIESAIANAKEKGADIDKLWVVGAWVDEGPTMMRFKPRARGSAFPIRKRSSHITVQLGVK